MHNHARRLVDRHQVIIFVEQVERDRLRLGPRPRRLEPLARPPAARRRACATASTAGHLPARGRRRSPGGRGPASSQQETPSAPRRDADRPLLRRRITRSGTPSSAPPRAPPVWSKRPTLRSRVQIRLQSQLQTPLPRSNQPLRWPLLQDRPILPQLCRSWLRLRRSTRNQRPHRRRRRRLRCFFSKSPNTVGRLGRITRQRKRIGCGVWRRVGCELRAAACRLGRRQPIGVGLHAGTGELFSPLRRQILERAADLAVELNRLVGQPLEVLESARGRKSPGHGPPRPPSGWQSARCTWPRRVRSPPSRQCGCSSSSASPAASCRRPR